MTTSFSTRIIRRPEVRYKVGYSDTTLDNRILDGLFPSGINLCGRAKGWSELEVNAVLEAMIAGKSKDEVKHLVRTIHSARTSGGDK